MTRLHILLASTLAALTLTACSTKPTEDNCRKAITNMRRLMGTENLRDDAGMQGEVRRCKGGSSKKAVDCAIAAQSLDDLRKCSFFKVPENAPGVGGNPMGSGSAPMGSAATGSAMAGSGSAMTGSGSAMTGSGSAMTGSGSAMTGSGSAMTGSGSAMAGSGSAMTGSAMAGSGSAKAGSAASSGAMPGTPAGSGVAH